MGETPRDSLVQLPLPTRSSEARGECFGRHVLSYLREDELAATSFFLLGEVVHEAIEEVVKEDRDLDYMQVWGEQWIMNAINTLGKRRVIESTQRGIETMLDDYNKLIENWFTFTHPDSPKRHPVYDPYLWPPRTEVRFNRKAGRHGVWGSVDAVYEGKDLMKTGHLLVDWKTGKQKEKSDFQLQFYRFGLKLPEADAIFHHVSRVRQHAVVQEVDTYPGDDEILSRIHLTEQRKENTLKGYMPKFTPGWYCGYCPAQLLCPADGPIENREKNRLELEKLLQLAVPMNEIPAQSGIETKER